MSNTTFNVKETLQKFKEGDNAKAVRGLMIFVTGLVIVGVSLYSAVIYMQFMQTAYPDNQFQVLAQLGAIANVLLMIVLLIGKFVWFKPGAQTVATWIITGVEVVICILNLILAYQLAHGGVQPGPIATWFEVAPASPVFSMVGAIIVLMTSSEMKVRHQVMIMEDKHRQAELSFADKLHQTQMEVQETYLERLSAKLTMVLENEQTQGKIEVDANMMLGQVLSQLSGVSYTPIPAAPTQKTLPSAKVVESNNAPKVLAQESSINEKLLTMFEKLNAKVEQLEGRKEEEQEKDTDKHQFIVKGGDSSDANPFVQQEEQEQEQGAIQKQQRRKIRKDAKVEQGENQQI